MISPREIALEKQVQALEQKLIATQNQLEAVLKLLMGKKTEKRDIDPQQISLFEEEITLGNKEDFQEGIFQVQIKHHKPKAKPVRKPLPENLRREIVEIYPDHIPQGAKLIGKEITEVLEIVSAEVYVKQYNRYKYALPNEDGVVIGPLPLLPIHKSNAGASVLAFLLIAKFCDHLPYYRQIEIFKRLGIVFSKSTLNNWFKKATELQEPLYQLMVQKALQSGYLMVDESTIPVREDNKKGSTFTGYHWVYYSPLEKTVIFDYQPGRKGKYPKEFLKNFKGHIQADGYGGYDYFDKAPNIILLACMAHARRKFWDAQSNDQKRANQALDFFGQLYHLEKIAREENYSPEKRYLLRQEKAKPIMAEFKKWLDENLTQTLPKSKIGKAIQYTLNLWHRLERYLLDGLLEIDNNLVENSIRPMALGRKNYLFAGNHQAAQNAAICRYELKPWYTFQLIFTIIGVHTFMSNPTIHIISSRGNKLFSNQKPIGIIN